MRKPLPRYLFVVLTLAPVSVAASSAYGQQSQAIKAALADGSNGFALPTVRGTLQYAVSVSESSSLGYNGTNSTYNTANISGDLAYLSISERDPFSLIYSGGYLANTATVSQQPSSFFQNLALSQVLKVHRWTFIGSDSFSYLPESAAGGLSGVPGVGDVGLPPVSQGDGQSILTDSSPRVNNSTSITAQRALTGSTSANVSGSYMLMKYLGGTQGNALDSDQEYFGAGLSHRIDARTSASVNFSYGLSSFSGGVESNRSQSLSIGYSHQLTRKMGYSVYAGPQRTSGNLSGSMFSLSGGASLSYVGRRSTLSAAYSSGYTNASGVAGGALTQGVTASARRPFGKAWSVGGNMGYTHSSGLSTPGAPAFGANTLVASGQGSRAIFRNLLGYVSYTYERQLSQGAVATNTLNGNMQVFAAGLTYSPMLHHIGHQ